MYYNLTSFGNTLIRHSTLFLKNGEKIEKKKFTNHLQTLKQRILGSSFSIGLLWLSAGIYKITASTAAAVVSHLERF